MMQKFILRVLLIAFISFSPVFCEDFAIGNALSKAQAMTLEQDPNGFSDLRWGQTLETVQQSHIVTFMGYYGGSAHYEITIKDAHGSLYFSGPVEVRGIFRENKLIGIQIPLVQNSFQRGYLHLLSCAEHQRTMVKVYICGMDLARQC